jgi:hypothetical protein
MFDTNPRVDIDWTSKLSVRAYIIVIIVIIIVINVIYPD